MKTTLSRLALALLLCGGQASAAKAGGMFPYKTHIETLDNGLQVILVPMSSQGLVAYWSIVRTGARDEYEPGHTGFAHFFEHMMFRGTEKYPQEKYGEITTKMGSDDNAFTSDDLTAYHLSVTSADLEQVIDRERPLHESEILADAVQARRRSRPRRVQQEPHEPVLHALRGDAQGGIRRAHVPAHDHGRQGRH